MKKILFLLSFITTTCVGQELPCPPSGSSVIGQQPTIKLAVTPPNNPENPRGKPPLSDDRLVFWIHGLGGNSDSWAKVAQATQYQAPGQSVSGYPHRKITSLPLTYSQFSLSGAASTLHNMLVSTGDPLCNANGISDKSINFIVSHSQGGIVSRATDKMYDDLGMQSDRRFGGIVTFGSPHGGAQIINNLDQFTPFADEACNALIAGPARENILGNKVVDFFVPEETFESIRNKLCSILANDIAPITFKDQFQPISEDYKVGAAPLGELNGHNGYTFPTSIPSCPTGCVLSSAGSLIQVTEKPSDGVVLAESASAYPGALTDEMPKSNHQQMRNDSNTKIKMLKVLEGGFGDYFITDTR